MSETTSEGSASSPPGNGDAEAEPASTPEGAAPRPWRPASRPPIEDAHPHHYEEPERLMIVPLLQTEAGGELRCVLPRWPDWPHPTLLPAPAPVPTESIDATVRDAVAARLGLRVVGSPRAATERLPARMPQPRAGSAGPGWLRAVAVRVEGEPQPDALLDGVELLVPEEAAAALSTSLERALLQAALDLDGEATSSGRP